jgi:hypothetical protein
MLFLYCVLPLQSLPILLKMLTSDLQK